MSDRRPSPLGGRKPKTSDLPNFATADPHALDDVLPAAGAPPLRLLIVGVNPGLWTAAVNGALRASGQSLLAGAPPGRPHGQPRRRLPGPERGGRTAVALARDRHHQPGWPRDCPGADELTREELTEGAARLVERVGALVPERVAIAGITAFRQAFAQPKAVLGEQQTGLIPGWPDGVRLWVVPQPSGLNAHETVETLAEKWRSVLADP